MTGFEIIERGCAEDGCVSRKRVITGCFGFVVAGDYLAAAEGRLPAALVRERCGICVVLQTAEAV